MRVTPLQVDEQACPLGDEPVVDLRVGGDDQREVGVLERVVEGDAVQVVVAQRGHMRVVVAQLRAEAFQEDRAASMTSQMSMPMRSVSIASSLTSAMLTERGRPWLTPDGQGEAAASFARAHTSSDGSVRMYDRGLDVSAVEAPAMFGEHQLTYRSGDIVVPRIEASEPLGLELADFAHAIRTGQ